LYKPTLLLIHFETCVPLKTSTTQCKIQPALKRSVAPYFGLR